MYSKKFLKKLSDVEQHVQSAGAALALEKEYRNWLINNPLKDEPDFSFDVWMDSMPKQFQSLFTTDLLSLLLK